MEQSNITYDHIALEAMKEILNKTSHDDPAGPWQRLRRFLGLPWKNRVSLKNPELVATVAYSYADALMAEREKRQDGQGE